MGRIYHFVYCLPLWVVGVLMVYIPFMGAALGRFACETPAGKRRWKVLCALALGVMLAVVFYLTLGNRGSGQYGVRLMPLQSFAAAKLQREYYRTMLMNAFLFVPVGTAAGLLLPESRKPWQRLLLTVLLCMGLSLAIEWGQYALQAGWAETDDVICNTLGSLIGCSAVWLKDMPVRKE